MFVFYIILLTLVDEKHVLGTPIHPYEQIQLADRIIEWKAPSMSVNVSGFPRGSTPILIPKKISAKLPVKGSNHTIGKMENRNNTSNRNLKSSQLDVELRIRTSITCSSCKAGIFFILSYVARSKTNERFRTISEVCNHFSVFPSSVCNGLVTRISPSLEFILNRANFDVNEFCATMLLNDECLGNGRSANENWDVVMPSRPKPKPKNIKLPKESSPSFKVLHLTDTHHDPHYVEGANAVCDEPLCCRDKSQKVLKESDGAGKWGDYRNCDLPKATVDNMLDHIVNVHPDIDYIIWTGDIQPHNIWSETKKENLQILHEMVATMIEKFPNTPIFPAIGNHEASPVNSFPQPFIADPEFSNQWLLDEVDALWSHWLSKNVSASIKYGGFYSVLVRPGFRIISMNTNFCYYINFWLLLNATDPASHLQWLVHELEAAELSNEKVHIIGHIPPGYVDCMRIWSRNYYKIVQRFESTITGQFFGHTHSDEIQIYWNDPDESKRAINVAYIAPSVTPFSNFNPGYKIYYVDGDHADTTRMVLDEEGWTFDLAEANLKGAPSWYKLYTARSSYGMDGLRPSDWSAFVSKMETTGEYFDLYLKHYYRDSPNRPTCDQVCKKELICGARSGRSHDGKVLCSL